jgi:hypothetical protein
MNLPDFTQEKSLILPSGPENENWCANQDLSTRLAFGISKRFPTFRICLAGPFSPQLRLIRPPIVALVSKPKYSQKILISSASTEVEH